MGILDSRNGSPWLRLNSAMVRSGRQVINPHQLSGETVKDRRELARVCIVIVLRVVCGNNVHVALEQTTGFILVICTIDPRIIADSHTRWELHLGDLSLNGSVVETELFDLDHFVHIDGWLSR